MAKKIKANTRRLLAVVLVFTLLGSFFYWQSTQAAALTALSDTMTRLKTGEASNHDIRFRTPSGMSSSTITINLSTAGFTTAASPSTLAVGDIDLQYGSSQAQVNGSCSSSCTKAALVAGAPGAGTWGVTFAGTGGNNITLTYPASAGTPVATNDYVRVLVGTNATYESSGANSIVNPSTGTIAFTVNVAGTTDTGKIAVVIITDDQVSLTASVDPSISFSLSSNSSAFGTISTSAVDIADTNITLTVGTNAGSGYTVTVQDAGNSSNPGLYNSTANYLVGSTDSSYSNGPTDLAGGTEGYGVCAYISSGSPTIGARYISGGVGCATDDYVGGLEITATTIFSRATSMSANDIVIVVHKAAVANWTAAGAYADTLTYIATGNF